MTARSHLADRAEDLAGFDAREVPFIAQVDLRVSPDDARGRVDLPLRPNTSRADCLWLGPDEWLLLGDPGSHEAVISTVAERLAGVHHSLVDVSSNRAILDLDGPHRRALLETGCGIDLHPRSWSTWHCAQTLVARVPVILQERPAATRVFVRPSFAGYLVDWLLDQASTIG